MLAQLSERVLRVETICQERLDVLETHVAHMTEDSGEVHKYIEDVADEVARMQGQLGLDPGSRVGITLRDLLWKCMHVKHVVTFVCLFQRVSSFRGL